MAPPKIYAHTRPPPSSHPIPLWPPRATRTADHSSAPRSAFAHAHPELFSFRLAKKPFHQLAAASPVQLSPPPRLRGKDDRIHHRRRSRRRNVRAQPVRFFPRAGRRRIPLHL